MVQHEELYLYQPRHFATEGGPLSYGPDPIDLLRRPAIYVDRISRGEKPGDLPVQRRLVINAKPRRRLGLTSGEDLGEACRMRARMLEVHRHP